MAKLMLRGTIRATLFLCAMWSAVTANACTISEDMEGSLPLNSVEIPNSARLRIADMVLTARQWPDVDIRGIVYAGGYVKERNPNALAGQRASAIESYLLQLGIKEGNIWLNKRIIRKPDAADDGSQTLNQIGVTLVPICRGGCDRLCDDPRVTPMSRAIK
ncbi:hypothetical protein [Caballeronia sp. GAFFF1]|uniref:hypothetical protein n=1 Tax=Caballeronia sp. GAFFF1 TaxID=2921779 RepID=UPI002027D9D5|nr:hypothetical protein [Caballeronia sp. GAFFF1]